jgi:hypothetical protein
MHVSHIINTTLTAALTILLKRVAGELIGSGLRNCLQLTRLAQLSEVQKACV